MAPRALAGLCAPPHGVLATPHVRGFSPPPPVPIDYIRRARRPNGARAARIRRTMTGHPLLGYVVQRLVLCLGDATVLACALDPCSDISGSSCLAERARRHPVFPFACRPRGVRGGGSFGGVGPCGRGGV